MKKMLVLVLVLITSIGFSQEKTEKISENNKKSVAKLMTMMTPKEKAELRLKKMTLHLDLTKEQQEKIYPLLLEQAKAKQVQREFRKKNKSKSINIDKFIVKRTKKLDKQIEFKAKMKTILNESQYEKFNKQISQRDRTKKRTLSKH